MHQEFRNKLIVQEYEHLRSIGRTSEWAIEMVAYKYFLSQNRIFGIMKEYYNKKEKEAPDVSIN